MKACNDPYLTIEALQNFDWKTTEPIKIRPFKPKYHLTMGMAFRKEYLIGFE
jgi:hypothetical protein